MTPTRKTSSGKLLGLAEEGVNLSVRVVPGASRSQIAGVENGRLKVKLQAPPVEGKANKELLKLLARELGLKKNRVRLARGEKAREKVVLLVGITQAGARERLEKILPLA